MNHLPQTAAVQATPLGPGAVKRVLSELKNLNDTSAAGIHVFPSEACIFWWKKIGPTEWLKGESDLKEREGCVWWLVSSEW